MDCHARHVETQTALGKWYRFSNGPRWWMRMYTHNSTGYGQDSNVDYCQERLCCSPEVLAVVHVQPEDGGKSDCLVKVRINHHIRVEWILQLNQLPNSALCRDYLH